MSKDLPWAGGVRRAKADRNVGYATAVGVHSGALAGAAPAANKPRRAESEREGIVTQVVPLTPKRDDSTRSNGRFKME